LKNTKNYFIEAKIYKLTESVILHQTLFQHQLGYVWPSIKHKKLFRQNVTNITFIFETSPIQNLKRKKWGNMAYYVPPSEKVGGQVPRVPHQIAPMVLSDIRIKFCRLPDKKVSLLRRFTLF